MSSTPIPMRRRAVARALAPALLAAGAVLVPALPSTAAPDTRPAVLGAGGSGGPIDVTIDDLAPRILSDEEELVVSGALVNTSDEFLENPVLTVSVSTRTPVSVAALEAAMSDDAPRSMPVSIANLGEDVAAGGSSRFEVRIPREDLPLDDDWEWGPRVVTVRASSGGLTGQDRSILVWDSGMGASPTRVSAVVGWTADTADPDGADRAELLEAARIPGTALAVDGSMIPRGPGSAKDRPSPSGQSGASGAGQAQSGEPPQSGRAGQQAEETPAGDDEDDEPKTPREIARASADRRFVADLWEGADEILALPEGDADLAAASLAGQSHLVDRALASLDRFPTTPEDAGWAPSEDAVSRATVIRDVLWAPDSSFGLGALAAFPDRALIAPPGRVLPADDIGFTSLARVEVDPATGRISTSGEGSSSGPPTTTVLAQQSDLADLLGWRPSSPADELDAEQALRAVTAIITRERPASSRTVLAVAPRGTPVDEGLVDRVETLMSAPWVEPTSFSDLASSEVTDVERAPVEEASLADDTATAIGTLSGALDAAVPLAEATDDPDAVLDEIEEGILPAISAGVAPDMQVTRASQFSARVSDLRTRVAVEPADSVNVINKAVAFPVRIRNSLDWDVAVSVTLRPSDPRLRAETVRGQTIPARSVATVDVPVTAIGSGDIEVTYEVSTPDGTVLDDSRSVLVRMRAGWEDALTITMTVGVGLLFIWGLVRTVRKRSRARARAEETDE
ncbi:DUF6049 family protein [Actinomyces sp. B33]|uniref:DUF6049 family protein n=1 Tax=Actinomyces sp. B33 TaxID=2942131 RepID=UPI00234134B9|nr:DUF6049 family protein [Actinomyces sp. B33]MDC4232568.1 DUF6049 family protein [Actinomyces sp. B33]